MGGRRGRGTDVRTARTYRKFGLRPLNCSRTLPELCNCKMRMSRIVAATLLALSDGLLVPVPSWRHATQPRHAAPCHPRHAPPCLLQPGEPFPSVEGVPSGTRAVLLVLTGDERRAAEIDAIETIKPELTDMNAVVLTLRNPAGWEAGNALTLA